MTEPPDRPERPTGAPETPSRGPETPTYPPPHQGGYGSYPNQPYAPGYQPGYQPGAYPPPPPPYSGYAPPPTAPKNGMGIAALVTAIIGLILCFTVAGGIILGLVAVVLGFIARGRAKRGEATNGGLALGAIALGGLAILAGAVFVAIWFSLWSEVGAGDFTDCLRDAGNDQRAQQQCADDFANNLETQFSITVTPTP